MNALRLVLVVVAMFAAGLIGWRYATGHALPARPSAQAVLRPMPMSMADAQKAVAARVSEAPEYASFYSGVETTFPADHARMTQDFVEKAGERGLVLSSDAYFLEAMRSLQSRRGIVAAKAATDKLVRIFAAQSAVLGALATSNPRLCGDFLYGGSPDGFMEFAASHRALIADMAVSGLEAITDGKTSSIERESPSDADFSILEQALTEKGLSRAEIEALIDGKAPAEPIGDTRMCEIGKIHLDTLRTLPEPTRSRILALAVTLMAHS